MNIASFSVSGVVLIAMLVTNVDAQVTFEDENAGYSMRIPRGLETYAGVSAVSGVWFKDDEFAQHRFRGVKGERHPRFVCDVFRMQVFTYLFPTNQETGPNAAAAPLAPQNVRQYFGEQVTRASGTWSAPTPIMAGALAGEHVTLSIPGVNGVFPQRWRIGSFAVPGGNFTIVCVMTEKQAHEQDGEVDAMFKSFRITSEDGRIRRSKPVTDADRVDASALLAMIEADYDDRFVKKRDGNRLYVREKSVTNAAATLDAHERIVKWIDDLFASSVPFEAPARVFVEYIDFAEMMHSRRKYGADNGASFPLVVIYFAQSQADHASRIAELELEEQLRLRFGSASNWLPEWMTSGLKHAARFSATNKRTRTLSIPGLGRVALQNLAKHMAAFRVEQRGKDDPYSLRYLLSHSRSEWIAASGVDQPECYALHDSISHAAVEFLTGETAMAVGLGGAFDELVRASLASMDALASELSTSQKKLTRKSLPYPRPEQHEKNLARIVRDSSASAFEAMTDEDWKKVEKSWVAFLRKMEKS